MSTGRLPGTESASSDQNPASQISSLNLTTVPRLSEDIPKDDDSENFSKPVRWSLGVLNDPNTNEVPGSVLLLAGHRNEPLGLRRIQTNTSRTSAASQSSQRPSIGRKRTPDGTIILEPQPDDSANDPLNWPSWRRNAALLSLGLYCMVAGGITPILAAGFNDVAQTYGVKKSDVALTTGLCMMGLGTGALFCSPTSILFGKRPIYLISSVMLIFASIWCAASPNYRSLAVARVFQGISFSPVECLPSASIAEIFFLHERAYRIGIYALLLLGGKNLVPLVSAAIIHKYGWRWVFWILAIIVACCWPLLFLFVPESFWDRTPRMTSRKSSVFSRAFDRIERRYSKHQSESVASKQTNEHLGSIDATATGSNSQPQRPNAAITDRRVSFKGYLSHSIRSPTLENRSYNYNVALQTYYGPDSESTKVISTPARVPSPTCTYHEAEWQCTCNSGGEHSPGRLHGFNSPFYIKHSDRQMSGDGAASIEGVALQEYTEDLRGRPALTFVQQLKPYNGRLKSEEFFKVMVRPFVLYAYPAILWSAVVYSCSVGWLILLSETLAEIFRRPDSYNFSALATGLVYLSPFVGGILGTAVAGRLSDIIVRLMARMNGGMYEPEFRLAMALPVAITTVAGLMGFGWSAEERNAWIVPTIFFGLISFGCSLGSTTAITFCVDSYPQYASESLVTLNFSKNIFHGFVFSLFINNWLEHSGSKKVFIWLGVIQLVFMAFTLPMYVFGKRARMWTVRRNLMEKF